MWTRNGLVRRRRRPVARASEGTARDEVRALEHAMSDGVKSVVSYWLLRRFSFYVPALPLVFARAAGMKNGLLTAVFGGLFGLALLYVYARLTWPRLVLLGEVDTAHEQV